MQSSYQIKISEKLQESLIKGTGDVKEQITAAIDAHADQIGYMLQSYYSREKVSKVIVIPGSITINDAGLINLKLEYVIEEFNACSAIDSQKREKMVVTIDSTTNKGVLNLLAENWPEL